MPASKPDDQSSLNRPTITWDRTKLSAFKTGYETCTEDTFVFEGKVFLKAYAKYLIEYLEGELA